jgi:hypothetical protein
MAICRPEAIDDAPLLGRSAAEDGGGGSFLLREEWASAQGKKIVPPPLRLRRSRRSRPPARSSQKEAVWSARGTAASGEDVANVRARPQEVGHFQASERKPWRADKTASGPTNRAYLHADERCLCRSDDGRQPRAFHQLLHHGPVGRTVVTPKTWETTWLSLAWSSPRGAEKARNAGEAATSVSDHALKRKGELHDGAPVRTARDNAGRHHSYGSAPFPVPDLRQVLAVLIDIKLVLD